MLKYFYIESESFVNKRKSLDSLYNRINAKKTELIISDFEIVSIDINTRETVKLVSPITGIRETWYTISAIVTYRDLEALLPEKKVPWWKRLLNKFKREEH
jgi:hypothetical protein